MPPKPRNTKPPPTHFLCIPLVPPLPSSSPARAKLAASLAAFRADICAPPALGGFDVPPDAVRPVGTLHLTLGVMSFSDPKGEKEKGGDHRGGDAGFGKGRVSPLVSGGGSAGSGSGVAAGAAGDEKEGGGGGRQEEKQETGKERLERAKEVLRGLSLAGIWAGVVGNGGSNATAPLNKNNSNNSKHSDSNSNKTNTTTNKTPQKPRITLRGLHSIQSPSAASVLYAPPLDPTGALQTFCESLRRPFLDAGLMLDEDRPLLLHATLVNTIYVRNSNSKNNNRGGNRGRGRGGGRGGGGGGRGGDRLTLDARGILDRYEDHVWIEDLEVDKVAICKMGAKKVVVQEKGKDGAVVEVEDEVYEVVEEVGF
ncbi:hypothetical protein VTJ04DRAFT_9288 [Mycothermus thermophilus]|uniref:uncharacterized protein n=1 Tax=Humicola insolens TaxID=85995 RepID=UPI003742A31E